MDVLNKKIQKQITRTRHLIEKGLILLGHGATYPDLVVTGFIPDDISDEVGKKILASIKGEEYDRTGHMNVNFEETRFGSENF